MSGRHEFDNYLTWQPTTLLTHLSVWNDKKKFWLWTGTPLQGSKKAPSGHPGQLTAGQMTVKAHLPNSNSPGNVILELKLATTSKKLPWASKNMSCLLKTCWNSFFFSSTANRPTCHSMCFLCHFNKPTNFILLFLIFTLGYLWPSPTIQKFHRLWPSNGTDRKFFKLRQNNKNSLEKCSLCNLGQWG